MQSQYVPNKIEKKWQERWEKENLYRAEDLSNKTKKYILVEFPYPSGAGLHVGHVRSYTALDIVSRKLRMQGYNVLYPIGWDAFGLPTENYAIKNRIHPRVATKQNIATFKRQLKSLGLSFDWSREIDTTDPGYYKWTQWIFLQMLERGLAYKKKMPINWCLSCKIGLANEEVIDGRCERCGGETEKREKEQWMLAITKYADRLIDDLETVDYLEKIKIQQINWIGKREGAEIMFKVKNKNLEIKVFTTRIDTIFSGTFVILAPEHKLIDDLKADIKNWEEAKQYIEKSSKRNEIDRTSEDKEKTGVELGGVKVINPATDEEMPIWISDFVLSGYGTGAVFADAHDERDFKMAKAYSIPLKISVRPSEEDRWEKIKNLEECFAGDGILVNSGQFDGLTSAEARPLITQWLKDKGLAEFTTSYKLRDWVFSRQHYWGEPIPVVHCAKCGAVPVPDDQLPVELPGVESYEPTDTGESPLAAMTDWVNVKCPKCGGEAKRETDTMPNWAGSSWYFLRYVDPQNSEKLADENKLKYWLPVDIYNGGMEHTTLHLLYSRFWHKFLFDIGAVPTAEPYACRRSHGMVLAADGKKMSKSLGNVINPDEIVEQFGADSLRLYEMFMGPFAEAIPWNTEGVRGVRRFLEKVWRSAEKVGDGEGDKNIEKLLHKTIKKVGDDIEDLRFNTAVSAMMILTNELDKRESLNKESFEKFLTILSPFVPHFAEELWEGLGHKTPVSLSGWPKYDEDLARDEEVELVVQINGKVRDRIIVRLDISEAEVEELVLRNEKTKAAVGGKQIRKIIFVPGKLINLVV